MKQQLSIVTIGLIFALVLMHFTHGINWIVFAFIVAACAGLLVTFNLGVSKNES